MDLAIIGLGSWGLCALERTVTRARITGRPVTVHVIEPGRPGGGVYSAEQPDYLVLNNPCGQLTLYAAPDDADQPTYAVGLLDWAGGQGYRWAGHECRVGARGRPIEATDYLPRRIMGEYLNWFFQRIVADAPANVEVVWHRTTAIDVVEDTAGRERVRLDDGTSVGADHVILTSGHTFNKEPAGRRPHLLRPYPVSHFARRPAPDAPVAVAGMGLVAFDLLTTFSIGRGGHFVERGGRLRYRRSGREPAIHVYSRSGLPYAAKPVAAVDTAGEYQPVICTRDVFDGIRERRGARTLRRQADFRTDLLPLVFAEMQVRYHAHEAGRAGGPDAAQRMRTSLRAAWAAGRLPAALDELSVDQGTFDPARHFFPDDGGSYLSSKDYEQHVYDTVASDLREARAGASGSPIKAALDITRLLRDDIRSVIEFGGLSLESYLDFQANIRGSINRLEAGPPPFRTAQLLALMDAGVVQMPFGPDPAVVAVGKTRTALRSTRLERAACGVMSEVVRGHLDLPSLSRSASPLLSRLYRRGRLTQLHYGDTPVGSVAISEDFHPYDVEGRVQPRISVLGVLTEGVRYFTHYLPSPRSRLRAVRDAQTCAEAIVG